MGFSTSRQKILRAEAQAPGITGNGGTREHGGELCAAGARA